uniref:Helicase ssl-1 n=2 Tax=Parascaris univalens TaxID=6257 RepID=A0A915AG66_PARUN
MSTRRSRRRSGAAATSDDPSGSEAPTESSSLASPPSRRRGREGASLRTLRSSDIAKNELASRILQQLKDLRIDFYRKSQASGADITELEFFDGVTKDGDAKNERQLLATLLCCSTPKHGQNEASASANLSPRVNCDASKLLPIEVKVEDVVPDSPSVSYSEQQPSTSSAVTASQSGVSLSGIPSQATSTLRSSIAAGTESNVERAAKQEAQVLARVAELRRQGLWTASRLPMIEMPSRNKTQWDYLLEEMRWMAADFRQERTFKRHAARKFATQIARLQRDKEQEEERAQQRAVKEAKRVCALIAKMVRDFWQNVDKVVDYRAQEIIESMKRKALDQQLELMVGQADKLSEMVQEGLTEKVSKAPSDAGDEDSNREDEDFAYMESESDDETTIAKAEATIETNVEEEMRDLERENNLELDDLLASLPPGYLESMGLSKPGTSKEGVANERSGGETSEEVSDEDEQEDNDATKEEDDSDDEPLVKKRKKPIDRVVEERSPAQSDSIGRSGSSASMKESEESSILPSEEVSKDMSEGINFARLTSESSEDRQKELANIAEEALKFQPKGFTLETTQVKTDVPSLIRGTLREYQLVGLDWLVTLYDKGLNGILADEMGLGKTIQTIALLAHLACKEANWGPHLIVVPTSVILNWEMELKKWCPAFKILTYFGSQKERAEKRKGWSKPNMFHVCVTSYKIVTQDIRSFKHKAWQYFILDEAQNIKNFKSQRWQTLLNIRARRRLLLTGTPLQNSLMELWSLMHFLMPAIFASHNDFKDWFSNPLTGMMEGSVEWNAPLVQRLHKVLRPFILRRLKVEVEKQLPEKTEHIVKCPLSKRQRYLYDDFMSLRSTRENLRSGSVMSVLNIVMQLRKCCNHPNLFEPRPVVSPFAMQPISLVIPAIIFDICNSECENDGLPSIPDCLRLDNVIRGSHFAHSEMRRLCVKKALIEELSQQETGSAMPKVEGFKFVRPPPPPKQMKHPDVQGGQLSTNVAAVSVPAGSLPQSGEYYVCVDNGTARVYQLVTTSSGERTIRECDPTAVAGSAATATPIMAAVEVPALPIQVASPPLISVVAQPVATQPGVEVKTEVKTESIVEVVGAPSEQRAPASTESEKPADRRAVFRTRTIMNKAIIRTGQALKQELTAVNNGCTSIHEGRQVMIPVGSTIPYQTAASTESPTRSRCVAQVRPLTASGLPLHIPITNGVATHRSSSPPLKRRRLIAPKIDRQPYAELILPETHLAQKERRQACVQRIAEMCARRIEWPNSRRAPLVSDELLSILIDEVKKKHRRKPRSEHGRAQCVELNAFECWEDLGWIHDRLRLLVEDMVDRFTVFVHGAIADAPKLEPTSVGRVAYRKQLAQERADICRRIFELDDPLVAKCRMMQMLQFPELRLIEYDCGKLQVLSSLLRDLFLYKHRCLIFTQMSRMLDVLQAFLSFHGYQYFRLDGTTGIEQRQAMMERFNSDPKIFCFILSTRSGGIGVNLTGADTVIFYDSDWNPTMDAQAQDRCHRIGQTRNVTIYRLISERTIEENILKKAMQKRRLGELAIDEGGFTPEFFKGDNLRELFQGEAAVADVVVPVTVSDVAELEKAMAKLEDVQDVAAAKRANAEAKAELAEFDESVLPNGDNSSNTIDRADSKYFELISQLKPIERYAINFLEAEYKPDFEEEVKEAEAMIASKKDEWLKAHETVMEGEPNEGDDEFDLTYSNGFGVAGSVDEVRNRRYKSASNTVTTKNPPPQKTRIVPVRSSSRIVAPPKILPPPSAATKLSRPQRRTLSDTTRSGNKTTTASSSSERPRRASSKKEYTTVANDNTLKLSKRRTTMDVNKVVEGDSDGKSKKRSKNELSLRKEGSVVVVDSDDEHSLASSSNEKDVYQKARSRNRQKNPLFSPTFAVPPSKNNSSDEPIPSSSSASGPVEYAQPSASNLRDFRKPQALGSVPLVMAPLSPTSFVPSTRSFVRPSPSVRNMMPSASVRCASLQSAQRTGYSGGVVQRYVTAPSQLPTAQSAATYMLATTQPTTISRPLQRAAASTSVQRRFVMVSRSSQDATSCPGQNALRLPVAVVSNAGATYRVVNAVRPGTNTNLVAQSSQQMASSSARRNIRITSTGTSYSNYSGMSRVASTSRSACVGYTKPSLGDYERPRLFFRKRPPLPSDDFTTASTGVSNNSSIDGKCADSTSS